MDEFLTIFNQYARSELLILVPVLYIVCKFLGASKVNNSKIPAIVTGISVGLCMIYTFATVPIINITTILLATFTSLTQGILFSGASILGGIFLSKKTCNNDKTDDTI